MTDFTCPTWLIEDIPSEVDLFSQHGDLGPHSRVAKAIASLIKNPKEVGGKVIGIEGGWGAGKTTVIRLLEKELSGDPNYSLFTFDAWAHEGDPLRRSFLEGLIKHFKVVKWTKDDDAWNESIAVLAKRKKRQTIKSWSSATTLGKIFGVSVLLVPIGTVLLSGPADRGLKFGTELIFSFQIFLGLLFAFAPFLVLLTHFFCRFITQKFGGVSKHKPCEYSGPRLPPIPVEGCHPFRLKIATHSGEGCHSLEVGR